MLDNVGLQNLQRLLSAQRLQMLQLIGSQVREYRRIQNDRSFVHYQRRSIENMRMRVQIAIPQMRRYGLDHNRELLVGRNVQRAQ